MALPFSRTFTDPELFLRKCNEYFSSGTINGGIHSNIGLRLHLDISRRAFNELSKEPGFDVVCLWANDRCEQWLMHKCVLDNKPVGSIFTLKAQYGWSDQPALKSETHNYVYVFGNEAKQLKSEGLKLIKDEAIDIEPVVKRKAGRPKGSRTKTPQDGSKVTRAKKPKTK